MIRTISPEQGREHPRRGERGDTLIEVLVAAVVVVLVVTATITGLNSANRATAQQRARSQADLLAQQDEAEFRSFPISRLSEYSKNHEVDIQTVKNGDTEFKITSTAEYINDNTATSSCTSSSASTSAAAADYIETRSEVTWKGEGKTSKPVVETGLVSPPPDSAVIAEVLGAAGEPVPNMLVETAGTTSTTAETSTDGCAIVAVSPGEYKLNVSRLNYVDQNGYPNSDEDPVYNSSFYLVAENTVKRSFQFAPGGEVAVKFSAKTLAGFQPPPQEGDSFVIYNSGMTAFRKFGTPETYKEEVLSPKTIFPFTSKYIVYAGTCEADMPTLNGQASNPEVAVSGWLKSHVTVPLAPIDLVVREGTKSAPGALMSGATVTLEDTGCGTMRKTTTNLNGELPHPGMPFGTYKLCVSGTVGGTVRRYLNSTLAADSETGTEEKVYLGEGEPGSC
jgi:Tfp pilus assembly protein PilV